MTEEKIAKITIEEEDRTVLCPKTGWRVPLPPERYVAVGARDEKEAHVYLISFDRYSPLNELQRQILSLFSPEEKIVTGAGYEISNHRNLSHIWWNRTIGFINPALSCVVPIGVLEPLSDRDKCEFLKYNESVEDFYNSLAVRNIEKYILREIINGRGWQVNEPPIIEWCCSVPTACRHDKPPRDAFIRNEVEDLKKIKQMKEKGK